MNVLITGASGFLGSNFIKYTSEFNFQKVSLKTTKVEHISYADIDVVLHFAALVHQMKGAPESEYFKINSDLTFELARRAKVEKIPHFIFISTAKVYGEVSCENLPFTELSECNPTDAYGKSKLDAEKRILALQDDNFIVTIVRIPLVYGIGVKGNLLSLLKICNKLPIIPLGGIRNKRSFLYVKNLNDFLKQIIITRTGGVLIAADKNAISTTNLVKNILRINGKRRWLLALPHFFWWLFSKVKPAFHQRIIQSFELNNSSTCEKLNFYPNLPIEEGLKEMIDWYKKNKL